MTCYADHASLAVFVETSMQANRNLVEQRDALLKELKRVLEIAEGHIYSEFSGTSQLEHHVADLKPAHDLIAEIEGDE